MHTVEMTKFTKTYKATPPTHSHSLRQREKSEWMTTVRYVFPSSLPLWSPVYSHARQFVVARQCVWKILGLLGCVSSVKKAENSVKSSRSF
ncbi:hypothetical protein Pmani_032260 [Petrolisthes manimaculis]|uniref:Uncharacterized protein n=1 Tax=Petrolisthes manimaculis TaxID=1843537 RepID=A0AAE1NU05_9EUCA|nr:hypothetical protein Pmani_032260 [Petrolisthes manimaculis]